MKSREEWEQLEKKLQKALTENRYRHTLGVAYTASALAMCHGSDLETAREAGMLHDCAKCMTNAEMRQLAIRKKIEISQFELEHPALLHSKLGVYVARDEYGISDIGILQAIRWHTTGKPDMSLLESIIFVSDYIEPNRDKAPRLPELRSLAFHDLNRCVYEILKDTVHYLSGNPKSMDPMTEKALKYYSRYAG
ncbi:MAG: bis(5'-nucleosyl)-tetraphosphatase (symmetrical) YqeK [Bilifractor sp.]|jgi:predicted HD superfamily hydrolase involved in NAD metabolism